jgi:F0F1-type ATP synthase assembly protein I
MSQSREPETPTPAGGAGTAGMNQGMRVLSYLIAGIGLYGAAGWAGDHWLGTAFLLPVGLVVGAGLAMYMVIKRFGAEAMAADPAPEAPANKTTEKGRS